jgi:radical SAM superfamily enzyme YgiQ (UPF0313 family)
VRILLLHPPSPFLIDDRSLVPLGALQVATVLNQQGHHAEVLDLAGHKDFVKDALDKVSEGWDAVGVSTTTQQTNKAAPIVNAIRVNYPSTHLVAGGAGPTNDPGVYLRLGFDKVVRNEGEFAFDAWTPGGARVLAPPLLDDLDKLPIADRSLVDVRNYRFAFPGTDGKLHRATHMMSTRGCPMSCRFCSGRLNDYYRRYRAHSPEYVVRELEAIRERWGFSSVTDYSDELNVDRKWLLRYCDLVKGRGFSLRGFCIAKLLDDELVGAMARAGFSEFCIGVESGNDEVLRKNHIFKTNRKTTVRACEINWA